MSDESLKKKVVSGFAWVLAQRTGSKLVSFVVSIILGRLLLPEEYGILTLVMVFVDLCDVFVESGFGKALIQKKDADDLDYSTVFTFTLGLSVVLFVAMYFAAPFIALFYQMPQLTAVTRVMSSRIIMASFITVQRAMVSREMQFKKHFMATISGTVVSAAVGIVMAYGGLGVWALVGQFLTNSLMEILVLLLQIRWKPKLKFSYTRMKPLISFGSKLLVAAMINSLYNNFRSLYVGKLYTADDLAYYSRGKQFPNLLIANITISLANVLFPAISAKQDDPAVVKAMTRRTTKVSAFVILPLMAGLAAVAEPLVLLLLTEKWMPCVPFLQILCISYALEEVQIATEHAINALGRSDVVLKLNAAKKTIGIVLILIFTRISVIAMALSGILAALICMVLNFLANKRILKYGYLEQLQDLLPCVALSTVMFLAVSLVFLLELPLLLELIVMVLTGVAVYVGLSAVFRLESFFYVLNIAKRFLKRK